MRRFLTCCSALLALGAILASATAAHATAVKHHSAQLVYFNSDHHIYRAPADRPTHRTSLPVVQRKHVIVNQVAVSPNGKRLVEDLTYLSLTKHAPRICIKEAICERFGVARADGTHVRWVFTGSTLPRSASGPVWSPDGRTIYYSVRYGDTTRQGDEYLGAIHLGKHVTNSRVPGGAGLTQPAPSPDGKTLVAVKPTFNSQGFATHVDLVTLQLSTGVVGEPLLSTDPLLGESVLAFQDPAWSPDGSTIALVIADPRDGPRDNERSRVAAVAADGSDNGMSTPVASGGEVYYEHALAWRTAHELWFSHNFASFGNTDDERHTGPADLYSVNVRGHEVSNLERLTHTTTVNELNASFAR